MNKKYGEVEVEIYSWYVRGYNDEKYGSSSIVSDKPFLNAAYSMGANDATNELLNMDICIVLEKLKFNNVLELYTKDEVIRLMKLSIKRGAELEFGDLSFDELTEPEEIWINKQL